MLAGGADWRQRLDQLAALPAGLDANRLRLVQTQRPDRLLRRVDPEDLVAGARSGEAQILDRAAAQLSQKLATGNGSGFIEATLEQAEVLPVDEDDHGRGRVVIARLNHR